jgi:hypothetical protein
MDELYPGKGQGEGFQINGTAKVLPATNPACRPKNSNGYLIAGFSSFGRREFFVHYNQVIPNPRFPSLPLIGNPNPSFRWRPLTTEFLANAIENDPTFELGLISERIGDVTYISGAEARDYGGPVQQGMTSLRVNGSWSVDGLRLSLSGKLGDHSAFLNKPTPTEFKNDSYALDLEFPWSVLRFLFYNEMGFVISNHQKFCAEAS